MHANMLANSYSQVITSLLYIIISINYKSFSIQYAIQLELIHDAFSHALLANPA